jgi:hypothetical protein
LLERAIAGAWHTCTCDSHITSLSRRDIARVSRH